MARASLGERAQLLHAAREAVARELELAEARQARRAAATRRGRRRGDVREGLGDDRRQLVLEPRYLRAQRAPRGALALRDGRPGNGSVGIDE